MTALQWIVKEAKKLKKEYPKRFSKWTDYVAQASAIYAKKHKGKSPVGKKKGKVSGVKKKTVKKKVVKKAIKKATPKSYHKDTKSHNVKISVVSGVVGSLDNLHRLIKEKSTTIQKIETLKINIKNSGDKETKEHFKFWLKRYKKYLLGLNKQISEAKKHI